MQHDTQHRRAIACIPDGHRRFARKNRQPLREVYQTGLKKIGTFISVAHQHGYTDVITYAFSEDNWSRTAEEIGEVFAVLKAANTKEYPLFAQNKLAIRVRVIGNTEKLPQDVQEQIQVLQKATEENTDITLWLCMSYNGRNDIVRAVNKAVRDGNEVTEEEFSQLLTTAAVPDPEGIFRTGGNQRLSGFLLWEAEYAEFIFTKTFWPELSREEIETFFKAVQAVTKNRGV